MKVALDLDGVLADLQGSMIDHTEYGEEDFEQWDKPEYNTFVSEASRVWTEHWDEIDPVEENIDEKTEALSVYNHVDIVTNTAGPDVAVRQWLEEHGVVYGSIVRPYSLGGDKPDLDYDVYIDDKPSMAGDVDVLYLRDQPWNWEVGDVPDSEYEYLLYGVDDVDVDCGEPPSVVRISSLGDVVDDLCR